MAGDDGHMPNSRFASAAEWPPPHAQSARVGLPPPDVFGPDSTVPQGGWQRPGPRYPERAGEDGFHHAPATATASQAGNEFSGVVGHIEPLHIGSPQPPALVEWLRRSRRPLWAWTPRMWLAGASSVMLCIWGGWLL